MILKKSIQTFAKGAQSSAEICQNEIWTVDLVKIGAPDGQKTTCFQKNRSTCKLILRTDIEHDFPDIATKTIIIDNKKLITNHEINCKKCSFIQHLGPR